MIEQCAGCHAPLPADRVLLLPNGIGGACGACLTVSIRHADVTGIAMAGTAVSRLQEQLATAKERGTLRQEIAALAAGRQAWVLAIPEVLRGARSGLPVIRLKSDLFATPFSAGRPWQTAPLLSAPVGKARQAVEELGGIAPLDVRKGPNAGLMLLKRTAFEQLAMRGSIITIAAPERLGVHPGFDIEDELLTSETRP